MQKYIRCHFVKAEPMTRGDYNKLRGWELPANENPADEGYHVVYPDGYNSWCPKDSFEKAARPVDGMTFGQAIEAMKQGKKVARKGWNGKGMYLLIGHAVNFQSSVTNTDAEMALPVCDSIVMRTAQGNFVVGWLASQTDMLSEDWVII